MPTNDYLAVATGGGANVESQVTYAADAQLPVGNQPGLARSSFVNKTLRQTSYFVANLAQYILNITGLDMLDDATPANILAAFAAAFKKTPSYQTFLTGSGTYNRPANCKYIKVKLVGGGGGGYGGTGNGTAGGDTTFGAGLLTGTGGGNPTGGGFSLGAAIGYGITGQNGTVSGIGGSTPWGGGGNPDNTVPVAPSVNSGAGGAGKSGIGGAGGGYVEAIIDAPAGTYAYAVGAGGITGTGGGGTNGAEGQIIVEEFY